MFNRNMIKNSKKKIAKVDLSRCFDEKDHRLACGWHVELEGSGQRKRYLRQVQVEKVKKGS
tara:strand:- start:185 stop:367 length:183 start_codon:yes stop_codon:yes gene_type:complete